MPETLQVMDVMRTLFAYDQALWRRVWASIETLAPEQFAQDLGYSHGSVRSQMFHVTEVSERWLRGLQGEPNAYHFHLDPDAYLDRATLRAKWEQVSADTLAHIATLSDEELAQTLPGMMGPTWHILPHLVNHGTDHRAQVLSGLHQLGAPTFAQDLIHHLWFQAAQG